MHTFYNLLSFLNGLVFTHTIIYGRKKESNYNFLHYHQMQLVQHSSLKWHCSFFLSHKVNISIYHEVNIQHIYRTTSDNFNFLYRTQMELVLTTIVTALSTLIYLFNYNLTIKFRVYKVSLYFQRSDVQQIL